MHLQLVEPGQTPEPHSQSQGIVVGIDLGTTHSVVGFVKDGKPELLSFGENGSLIPSILSQAENALQVGVEGQETLSSTKRLMGQGHQQLNLGKHILTPVEVASHILSHLRQLIEKELNQPLEAAVITVPAYFDEAARVATKQAAALAGIKVLRLLNEPTAAALAYGLEAGASGIYAVYDLGGGTFDLSILKLNHGVFQVLATGGDLTLGGDDIDQALASQKEISLKQARLVKEKLSEHEEWTGIRRQELEDLATPLIQKTIDITRRVLGDADLSPQEIQGVVLVGGMTRMPLIRHSVEALFGKTPLCKLNPDEAVAMGAAVSAHGLTHGSQALLLDVTPLSLGLETMGGLVETIIPRNSPLPALASQEFTTYEDGQGGMVIHVVQGEREFVSDCLSLARFELFGLPPLPKGAVRVRIDFAVDVEGLLTVTAFEKTTGTFQHVEVRPTYGLDQKAISKMILESQKHGKEDIQKRLEAEDELKRMRFGVK
jgi:molecular chaperone HscA